jgi:5-methylcytosine-specific restriction endonuclease McrA
MTDERVAKAQEMCDSGMTYRAIGVLLGVSRSTVRYALNPQARERTRLREAKWRENHKEETCVYNAAYREDHREEECAYSATYRKDHKEEMHAYQAAYWKEHKEEIRIQHATYRKEHKEEIHVYRASYRKTHKSEIAAYLKDHEEERRAYRKDHSSEYAAHSAARHALIAGATIGNLVEIKEIYRKAHDDEKVRCYLCEKLIPKRHRHVDHIIPLSKGGQHRPSNLAIACDKCNLMKSAKMPEEVGVLI